MTKVKYLKNAPITEAVIQFRVKQFGEKELQKIKQLEEIISDDYPNRQDLFKGSFKVSLETKPSVVAQEQSIYGFRYTSNDEKQVVQYRLDGFAFSRLKPYESWDSLRKEAFRLWNIYSSELSPEFISRVSTRYINRMNIPLPIENINEYIAAPPSIPTSLRLNTQNYLVRFTLSEPSTDFIAIITQMTEPTTESAFFPIILDIDVLREYQFSIGDVSVWETLERLRDFKNKIFFESITEKTEELFK